MALPVPLDPLAEPGSAATDETLRTFYSTARAGQARLSDGGGPFGFDVTVALLAHDLITAYACDAIVETGCYLGDTTAYLARRYPALPVRSCDLQDEHVQFTRQRLTGLPNAHVSCLDSPALVSRTNAGYQRPFYFLDAHWGHQWPLSRELAAIRHGVVLIHDFDIGHPRFSYDVYDGQACGPSLLASLKLQQLPRGYFTPDPEARWPLPCLQVGRRSGVGVLVVGMDERPLRQHHALICHDLPARAVVPT